MPNERAERRLTAILAADVAGYSRLMGTDEEGTLARPKAHRRELVDLKIAEHRGRIVKTTGDGILVEFPSVVDAVRCAVDVQRAMAERNAEVPSDRRIEFRVGINLGDIIIDGDDIYGDGVNVAARLEGLAEPGGLCISRKVRDEVRDKLDLAFEDMGEQEVKNIARPVRVFRIAAPVIVQKPTLALPDKPSIAVLPFENMSGDPEQEYFADGIVEDIITALSRVHWLFVIARNSSFTYKGKAVDVKQVGRELGVRYVLEGSVRKASNRVRITGQLVDATTGAHVWADHFDGALDDIFDLQDRVTASVVGIIEPKLRQAETERSKRKRPESLDAYDAFLRGLAHQHVITEASLAQAFEFLKTAISIDPAYAPALALAALCKGRQCVYGWVPWSEPEVQEAVRLARAAVEADRDDPVALAHSSRVLAHFGADYDLAINVAERAAILNPNSAEVRGSVGMTTVLCGLVDDGIRHAKEAMKLSPLDPDTYLFCNIIALAHLFAERFGDAVSWCERAINENPNFITPYRVLAASLAHLGRLDEARTAIRKAFSLQPNQTLERAARAGYRKPEHMAIWLDGLRKAGLPE
ncbi:adenylate cyclase [Rhizobiales bacterium GAS188]|nr:adenylate cyclase [Rhizobiales bacterium GAS188]